MKKVNNLDDIEKGTPIEMEKKVFFWEIKPVKE